MEELVAETIVSPKWTEMEQANNLIEELLSYIYDQELEIEELNDALEYVTDKEINIAGIRE